MEADAARPVLIVEDDPQVRDVLEELLQIEGFSVRAATNGADALAMLRSGLLPGVILLDSMMPRMNGAQFLKTREREPELLGIPVYLISASGDFDGSAGYRVEGFLRKPFDPERLLEIVRRHCPPGPPA